MNTDEHRFFLESINATTELILKAAYEVSNTLGCGFLEKVYENALVLELGHLGLQVSQQRPIEIRYRDKIVGEYVADLVVNNTVLVELKAAQKLEHIHQAQCLNSLTATRLPICLLLNFGQPRIEIKRILRKGP